MRPIALALALLASGTGCRSLLIREEDPFPAKVAKFTTRFVLAVPTLGASELRMTTAGLQERVEASQAALDYLYRACRDAAPGSDEARRACWDYQRGHESDALATCDNARGGNLLEQRGTIAEARERRIRCDHRIVLALSVGRMGAEHHAFNLGAQSPVPVEEVVNSVELGVTPVPWVAIAL